MGESGDASAVSHGETGPAREPWPLYAVANWTRQGTDGFLGHERCQGQTSGLRVRRHGALILMGVWCGAQMTDTTQKKTGMRLGPQVGGVFAKRERNGKKWSKVV